MNTSPRTFLMALVLLAGSSAAAFAYQYGEAAAPDVAAVASGEARASTVPAASPVRPEPAKTQPQPQPQVQPQAKTEVKPPASAPNGAPNAPASSGSQGGSGGGAGGGPTAGAGSGSGGGSASGSAPKGAAQPTEELGADGQKLFDGGTSRPGISAVPADSLPGNGKPSPVGEPIKPYVKGLPIGEPPLSLEGSAVNIGQPDAGVESWLDAVRRRARGTWDSISDSVGGLAADVKALLSAAGDGFKAAFMAVWNAPEAKATGSVRSGGLVNGIQMPDSPYYSIVNRSEAWGTKHMILGLMYIGARISLSGGPTMRIGDISDRNGGQLGGHKSHRRGVDVDIPFFYNKNGSHDARGNYQVLQYLYRNPFMTAEMIFVSPRVKTMLLRQAQAAGDGALASWAQGKLMTGEPGHDNHFHVRVSDQSKLSSWLSGS